MMTPAMKRIFAQFFKTASGQEPAREWLMKLEPEDRKTVGTNIKDVEFGWPIGKPLAASLGRGLWEVRSSIRDGIARVIFYVTGNQMILLHGFVKKTQKTPKPDLDLGFKRMKEHMKGEVS